MYLKNCSMYRHGVTFIRKDTRSSVKHSHPVRKYFYMSIIYKLQQIPTKLYSSLCILPQTNDTAPLRKSTHIINTPPLIHHHHHMCQNITLTKHSNLYLIDLVKYVGKNMKN